jgi:urease accessory protein
VTRDPPTATDRRAGWHARLHLPFHRRGDATIGMPTHEGPLRVLKSMVPEGEAVCHQVIVHPPGGIVGGDVLEVDIDVDEGAHAVLTTPGATRFYRSAGSEASQTVQATLRAGARLEWVPLETIVHHGALAANRAVFRLGPGASMIGWDVTCLGLPAAGEAFGAGCLRQHLELEGLWLERARIDAADDRLLRSQVGFAGHPVVGTAWVAWDATSVAGDRLLEEAWQVLGDGFDHRGPMTAAVTQLQPGLIVARALAQRVEPVGTAFRTMRKSWRASLWGLAGCEPRVWGA